MSKLLVLESPNKIKKLRGLVGPDFQIVATVGHFRDLPRKDLAIDLETFEPTYVTAPGRKDIEARLCAAAKDADEIYLATDPDREGEAIAWHAANAMGRKGRAAKRVRFQELTARAVQKALSSPAVLDMHLVDAQQARRVLDRLCGYQISPVLWPYGKGLSAGRVQSATLSLVVERQRARDGFEARTYYHVVAEYDGGLRAVVAAAEEGKAFKAVEYFDQASADVDAAELRELPHVVDSVESREVEQKPNPPFTTSSLQQTASSLLRMAPAETMKAAQKLFEGGYITYHRTDSVFLSDEAITMARDYLAQQSPTLLPAQPPHYKSKANAQQGHEAIRVTSLPGDEDAIAELGQREAALYKLIRDRFLASQCANARILKDTILITAGQHRLLAKTTTVLDKGYKAIFDYDETQDAPADDETSEHVEVVVKGDKLQLEQVSSEKKTTKPPPAFTEATLVREMEKVGIGRPSTYAATVALLFDREYVERDKRHIRPTERGVMVVELLSKTFSDLLDSKTTAEWEEQLDGIANGRQDWRELCRTYQCGLVAQLERAATVLPKPPPKSKSTPTGKLCPLCGKELYLRTGKKGAFLGCSGYPKCRFSVDADTDLESAPKCPECERPMIKRKGSKGTFWGCSGFPECRATRSDSGNQRSTKKPAGEGDRAGQ